MVTRRASRKPDRLSVRFATDDRNREIRGLGSRLGFAHVEAGPFVRWSYHAGEQARTACAVHLPLHEEVHA
jgi:lipoate synthase